MLQPGGRRGARCEEAGWGADVVVSGSAIYDRKDPAGNLDLMIKQLSHSEEEPDGKR
jgi:pentose-5-phosphate-3-epimerase